MSSSRAAKRRPNPEDGGEEQVVVKKPKIGEAFEGEQSTSGEGIGDLVSREDSTKAAGSDEEFKLETDTSEDGYSDVQEGDSSDLEEEDHVTSDTTEPTIVSGLEVQLKEVSEGKYRLFHNPYGREFKMVIPLMDRTNATAASRAQEAQGVIPVLEATGVDIPRDNDKEVMAYVETLAVNTKAVYPYCDAWKVDKEGKDDEKMVLLQGNVWTLLLLDGCLQLFATGEFIEDSADTI